MAGKVLAAVRVGPSKTEIREFPMPEILEDSALMKMEVAGICGTDVKLYETPPSKDTPVIMGHENIGYIAKAGREFTRRKGVPERKSRGRCVFSICSSCGHATSPSVDSTRREPKCKSDVLLPDIGYL